eukprot:TRINITY_DN70285_c0_g1_i1.p1 TRINITY_DN70285_c0_g1~~TRINITY_DN70285_c0_g1_i1.p1  ORF type:complete len:297 (+),score=29.52 TRINITY_DN70285_c0_g1_i1:51-941(+)
METDLRALRQTLGADVSFFSDRALQCALQSQDVPSLGIYNLAAFFARRLGCGKPPPRALAADIGSTAAKPADGAVSPSVLRAASNWRQYLRWRDDLSKVVLSDELQKESLDALQSSGSAIFGGSSTRHGRPVCWVRPTLHPCGQHRGSTLAYYYDELFQTGCRLADAPRRIDGADDRACSELGEQKQDLAFDIVYDRRGLGFWHARKNAAECRAYTRDHVHMTQPHTDLFYNRIGSVYVLGVSPIFSTLWNTMSFFLTAETASKVRVLRDVTELRKYMEKDGMPEPWRTEVFKADD